MTKLKSKNLYQNINSELLCCHPKWSVKVKVYNRTYPKRPPAGTRQQNWVSNSVTFRFKSTTADMHVIYDMCSHLSFTDSCPHPQVPWAPQYNTDVHLTSRPRLLTTQKREATIEYPSTAKGALLYIKITYHKTNSRKA